MAPELSRKLLPANPCQSSLVNLCFLMNQITLRLRLSKIRAKFPKGI